MMKLRWGKSKHSLCGHEHNYERISPIKNEKVDQKGVVYVITGGGGAPLYEKKMDNSWSAFF